MQNMGDLNPTVNDVASLRNCKCFPVNLPYGRIEWMDSTAEFAIAGRLEYAQVFESRISILDSAREEVYYVTPFLIRLELH